MSASLSGQMSESSKKIRRKPPFLIISLFGIGLIAAGVILSLASITEGMHRWPEYLNLKWAHQDNLIQILVTFSLMVWLLVSTMYFGGWLFNRSLRKYRGKSWSLASNKARGVKFFPPVLIYLKLSCLFLMVIFLFVILQYPLQYIVYPFG